MKVAVVILNWNGIPLLKQFLPSVVVNSQGHSIYVIDNGSEDGSVDWLKITYPDLKVISLPQNLGYAGGYNQGLKQIEEEVYILLNSDVEVTPNWIDPLIKLFEENPGCVAIQPKIVNHQHRDRFDYAGAAGGFLDKLGYPYCRGRIFEHIENDEGQYDDVRPIFWASGPVLWSSVKNTGK
ncbi:glycosyltransferase family 2 protein [Aureitalea marina]|uniref:glycosyltransferase family 2 protein n=1 Tax=Aureitalea marina TaxID=930804 RepID=UPI0026B71A54